MLPSKVARDFAHLAIPLKVVATDFYAQEQVVLDSGDLRSAIAASMALPALFTPVTRDGRVLMDGGLVNPLPFDVLDGERRHHGRHRRQRRRRWPPASACSRPPFAALMASSQILQRSIVREKLKARQPDIYVDVEVDEFHVLEFHRFEQVLGAAGGAKDQLKRQLDRVLASQHRRGAARPADAHGPRRARRSASPALKRLTPEAAGMTQRPRPALVPHRRPAGRAGAGRRLGARACPHRRPGGVRRARHQARR